MEKNKETIGISLKDFQGLVSEEVNKGNKELADKLSSMEADLNGVAKNLNKGNINNGINQARVLAATIESIRKQQDGGSMPSGGRAEDVRNILVERYGKQDPSFVKDFEGHYKDLMATGNGGELIIEEYAAGFLDQLWDETILPKLGVNFIPTASGNLKISKIIEGVSAGYINEGGTIDTSTIKFGHIRLSVKKLMALVPISNDLLRYAHINAEALVVDQITKEMAQVADWAFLYGSGGEFEPLGVKFTPKAQKVAANPAPSYELGLTMLGMLGKKNHGTEDAKWVMGWDTYLKLQLESVHNTFINKAELDAGRFVGKPFVVASKVENKDGKEDLFLLKTNDITAIQGMGVTIVASNEASIHTKDGMMSAFGQDYTIIRALVEHDFGVGYGHSIVLAEVDTKAKA